MNKQFNNLLMIQKELGSNTQEMSISQNTQNCSRIRSIKRNLKITGFQEMLRIGGNITKKTKYAFFEVKIQEIVAKKEDY